MRTKPYDFWERFDVICSRKGYTLMKVCQAAGVRYQTVLNQRSQLIFPKIDVILSFCEVLGVSPNTFFLLESDVIVDPVLKAAISRTTLKNLLAKMINLSDKQLAAISTVVDSYLPEPIKQQNAG